MSTPSAHSNPRRLVILAAAATGLVVAACGVAGSTAAPTGGSAATQGAGTLPTGMPVTDVTKLSDLIGPGDFATAGIEGAGTVTATSDGPGSAYCVFKGTSAGTGGIEFDIFVGDDAEDTYQTILDEAGGAMQSITIPGVAEAVATDGTAGKADAPASVVVRTDKLAFTIAAPGGAGVSARLATLAALVVARAASLAG